MKIVAFIPIKLGSERVPGKNIKPFFDGVPLMHFIQRVCLASKAIDEAYVYCSDESITDYLLPGIKFLKRPEWLDRNEVPGNKIIDEFIKAVDSDIYIETHATTPFATAVSFDICVSKVVSGEYDSAFCASKLQNFLWQDGKPLNFDPGNFPRTQDLPAIFKESANAYVFTKIGFQQSGQRVGAKPYIHIISEIEAVDIDYPEDFVIANAIYKEVILKNELDTTS